MIMMNKTGEKKHYILFITKLVFLFAMI